MMVDLSVLIWVVRMVHTWGAISVAKSGMLEAAGMVESKDAM